jgi:hypothetical protein
MSFFLACKWFMVENAKQFTLYYPCMPGMHAFLFYFIFINIIFTLAFFHKTMFLPFYYAFTYKKNYFYKLTISHSCIYFYFVFSGFEIVLASFYKVMLSPFYIHLFMYTL